MGWDTVEPYQRGFREFTEAYEAFGFEDIHRDALPYLSSQPALVLDVGAGSGRDAAWFAARGWDVIAVEPASAMRALASRNHPDARIRWMDDRLPGLSAVHRLGLAFDLVWVSGVWHHVAPEERPRAMRKLATLLKPGGRLVLTLRHGPAPPDRPMWPVNEQEVERLGLDHGLALRVATLTREDRQGRSDVRWQTVILDLPDDGAGALPLLRGVILRQEKNATYKLALLRAIGRIADTSPNVAQDAGDDVELPLGLVALCWLRMYKPLVEAGLPQRPDGRLAFVDEHFHELRAVAPFDLRPVAEFQGGLAASLARSLTTCARLIANMPARHLTYADDTPVFPAEVGAALPRSETLRLDSETFWRLGRLRVPGPVWGAMRRLAAWIEPMLLAEWVRQTQAYSARSTPVPADAVVRALRWLEPARDTAFVRALATRRLQEGKVVRCVWSGRTLSAGSLDIDHCLPWAAWACGDLWNLLPTHPRVNQREKRDLLIGAQALRGAKPQILSWWEEAYCAGPPAVSARFSEEARLSLPVGRQSGPLDLEELFDALDFRRLRLKEETHLREWGGVVRGQP